MLYLQAHVRNTFLSLAPKPQQKQAPYASAADALQPSPAKATAEATVIRRQASASSENTLEQFHFEIALASA